jgi:hypothetical protein
MPDMDSKPDNSISTIYIQDNKLSGLDGIPYMDHADSTTEKTFETKSDTKRHEDGQENLEEFVKDVLNDYLQDQRCDRQLGKKIKQGMELLSDAVDYCYNRTDETTLEVIKTLARELALANELIGLLPADIAC